MLNEHLLEEENSEKHEGYTRSAVESLILRMNPKIEKITKRKKGSKDPTHPWSRARFLWSKQLLVRFGELPSEPEDPRFDRDKAGKLELSQIVWWDETHRKCLIGGISTNRNFTMKFRRNKDGKLDLRGGEFDKKQIQIHLCQ